VGEAITSVHVEGSDLYYEEKGEGPPILLIHAGGATASTWGRVVDDLARVGRVIAYDRRGYERSGGEPVRSISTHTEDAAALLDALRSPPVVAVGISVSATIAIDLALRVNAPRRRKVARKLPSAPSKHKLRHKLNRGTLHQTRPSEQQPPPRGYFRR
jgi:pimeloyl-ACP methyl ester carboxylesterase